jgi:hypothetical protein
MPNFYCPKCKVKLRLKHDIKSNSSIWVKCPICSEIFHPQQQVDLAFFDASQSPKDSSRANSLTSSNPASQLIHKLANKISSYSRRSPNDEPMLAIELPAAPPQKNFAPILRTLFFVILISATVFFLGWGFVSAVPDNNLQSGFESSSQQVTPDYSASLLFSDLKALRENLRRSKLVDKMITYRGFESRFYKYFTQLMGKNNCQDISKLRLFSDNTSKGFTAIGVCHDNRLAPAKLVVVWDGEKANISIVGQQGSYTANLLTKQLSR